MPETLAQALVLLNEQFHLAEQTTALLDYMNQDPHGGYPDAFPIGSMWQCDGQFLYALVRAIQPLRILELGTMYGCSATHILQALHDNGKGSLICVDSGVHCREVGELIPDHLRYRVTIVEMDMYEFLRHENGRFNLVFEDGLHERDQVAHVWRQLTRLLYPQGMIVSHDAAHYVVGSQVQAGIADAGFTPAVYDIEPAHCGFALCCMQG